MPEIVLFEDESTRSRAEIAEYLRSVADKMETGDAVTFSGRGESVEMDPPERPTFEVKLEREGPEGGPYERSIELEIEWDERDEGGDGGGGDLTVG